MFLILKVRKPVHSTQIISPDIENKKVTPNYNDFVYQPVNSEWRARQCKDVLDNQTTYPLQIHTNDTDCSCVDLRKCVVNKKSQ